MALEFRDQLQIQLELVGPLCAGMDADLARIPEHFKEDRSFERDFNIQGRFLREYTDAVAPYVSTFKPNVAFFEGHTQGPAVLEFIVSYIHDQYPGKPVIGDIKRNDIGKTNTHYADAAFNRYNFDAVTTTPYFGADTFPPFLEFDGKGLIIMCKTSNPGSDELQDMPIYLPKALKKGLILENEYEMLMDIIPDRQDPTLNIYEMVAFFAAERWSKHPNGQNIGLVVGATKAESFLPVRKIVGDMPLLIPGVGKTQGGRLEDVLRYAPDSCGMGMMINIGSEALFSSDGRDFADAAEEVFRGYHQRVRNFALQAA